MYGEISFEFYSDTNIGNAFDELEGLTVDGLRKEGDTLFVAENDYLAMRDSIDAIVKENGGNVLELSI